MGWRNMIWMGVCANMILLASISSGAPIETKGSTLTVDDHPGPPATSVDSHMGLDDHESHKADTDVVSGPEVNDSPLDGINDRPHLNRKGVSEDMAPSSESGEHIGDVISVEKNYTSLSAENEGGTASGGGGGSQHGGVQGTDTVDWVRQNATESGDKASGTLSESLPSSTAERVIPQAERGLYVDILGMLTIPAWSVGLFLGVTGYTMAGLGMNLIRLSHLVGGGGKAAAILDKLKETRFNRKSSKGKAMMLWYSGYGINAVGGTINSFGLKFTAQSLMAPLSSVALVSNAVWATYLNGETLRVRRDIGSILLIFIGNCITVSTGNHAGYRHLTLSEVTLMWSRRGFVMYLCCMFVAVLSLWLAYLMLKQTVDKSGGRERASPEMSVRLGLCHAGAGCMLGVNSVLMAKSLMLVLSGGARMNLLRPGFVLLAMLWAMTAGFWVFTLNKLLREYDALFIVPVIEVVWSLMSMVSGGIFFDEYRDLFGSRLFFFFVGVAFNVTGIWLIGHGKHKSHKTQV